MLWVLTKSPTEGSSTLADWKQYLNSIYQGVLYIHKEGSQVGIIKCNHNSWSVRTYDTKTIGIADIAKNFTPFKVDTLQEKEFLFEGGWIWNAWQVGEMMLDDAIENIRDQQLLIEDMEKRGDVDGCNDKIDELKNFISTIQLPEAQKRQLKEFLRTFDKNVKSTNGTW